MRRDRVELVAAAGHQPVALEPPHHVVHRGAARGVVREVVAQRQAAIGVAREDVAARGEALRERVADPAHARARDAEGREAGEVVPVALGDAVEERHCAGKLPPPRARHKRGARASD